MSDPILELPVQPTKQKFTRTVDDVRGMGIAVQANLVQLRVRQTRSGHASMAFENPVSSPGAVLRFRETLIGRDHLKRYSEPELLLRTHEVWGQFCLLQWSIERELDDESAIDFVTLSDEAALRCDSALGVKLAEISGSFWRIRFEQRHRQDADYATSSTFVDDQSLAESIPVAVFGKPVADASPEELLCASCEFVGMVSALRWVVDRRREWGEPGIGEIGDRPF